MLNQYAYGKAKDAYTRASLTSKTPTHTRHQESIPSLLHSPSGPDFPCQCSFGVVEKKAIHITLSVWLPNLGFSRIPILQSHSIQSKDQPLHTRSKTSSSQLCDEDKDSRVTTPNEKVNTAQVRQDDSELFMPLAWPKQLSGTQKMIAFTVTNNIRENHNKPQFQGKKNNQSHG